MNTTDRLRQAAQTIRTASEPASADDSRWYTPGDFAYLPAQDPPHIALWSPPVALAVADWLEDIATDKDSGLGCIHPRAVDVTNLILGGDQ